MDELMVIELARATLMTALLLVTPALLVGMFVGLFVSLVQTVTSLQEQTLAMVPKMLAVVGTVIVLLPWILGRLRDFARGLFENLALFGTLNP
jgi:flagellar biosynthetic protein FliQ